MNLQLQVVRQPADLPALREAWSSLDSGIVFRSYDWLTTWWDHYERSKHDSLCVVVVRNHNDEVLAIDLRGGAETLRLAQPPSGHLLGALHQTVVIDA